MKLKEALRLAIRKHGYSEIQFTSLAMTPDNRASPKACHGGSPSGCTSPGSKRPAIVHRMMNKA